MDWIWFLRLTANSRTFFLLCFPIVPSGGQHPTAACDLTTAHRLNYVWTKTLALKLCLDQNPCPQIMSAASCPTMPQALELLAEARSAGLLPNIVAYTTAVEACATAGKFSSVLSLLDQMSSEGVDPSVVTFSSALK